MFFIKNKRYINYDRKYKRRMKIPPHKIQNTNQNKTMHLHYTRRAIHKSPQDQTQFLLLLVTPFELQI